MWHSSGSWTMWVQLCQTLWQFYSKAVNPSPQAVHVCVCCFVIYGADGFFYLNNICGHWKIVFFFQGPETLFWMNEYTAAAAVKMNQLCNQSSSWSKPILKNLHVILFLSIMKIVSFLSLVIVLSISTGFGSIGRQNRACTINQWKYLWTVSRSATVLVLSTNWVYIVLIGFCPKFSSCNSHENPKGNMTVRVWISSLVIGSQVINSVSNFNFLLKHENCHTLKNKSVN